MHPEILPRLPSGVNVNTVFFHPSFNSPIRGDGPKHGAQCGQSKAGDDLIVAWRLDDAQTPQTYYGMYQQRSQILLCTS